MQADVCWLGLSGRKLRSIEQHAHILAVYVHRGHVGFAVTVEVRNGELQRCLAVNRKSAGGESAIHSQKTIWSSYSRKLGSIGN